MVFSSLKFIFIFLPAFLAVYYIIPDRWKNFWIFAGSMIFYGAGSLDKPQYILLLAASVFVNFMTGKAIGRSLRREAAVRKGHRHLKKGISPKAWFIAGVVYDLAWLCVFKYTDFIFENINALFDALGRGAPLDPLNLQLPVGIIFYTFQSISYLADVYRGDVEAERSFADFGAYLTMFPQLIAGPIIKYREIRAEMKKRTATWADFDSGLRTFTLGLGMKVLLANRIGSLWSDIQTVGFESISVPVAWMGIFAYSFQLYFDFYGYSMMAIGLGRMMGFTIPQNFDHPYESVTMTEFWRRWHMTLGSWFREYVYIPLGGNRRSAPRVYFNLFVVWLLTGFWHGAGWNFILWGLMLFCVIAIEKAGLKNILERKRPLGHLYMFFLIPLMWMVFAITDMGSLGVYAGRLIGISAGGVVFAGNFSKFLHTYGVLMAVCAVLCVSGPEKLFDRVKDSVAGSAVLFAIFWGSVYCLYIGLNDPFMYFRF